MVFLLYLVGILDGIGEVGKKVVEIFVYVGLFFVDFGVFVVFFIIVIVFMIVFFLVILFEDVFFLKLGLLVYLFFYVVFVIGG